MRNEDTLDQCNREGWQWELYEFILATRWMNARHHHVALERIRHFDSIYILPELDTTTGFKYCAGKPTLSHGGINLRVIFGTSPQDWMRANTKIHQSFQSNQSFDQKCIKTYDSMLDLSLYTVCLHNTCNGSSNLLTNQMISILIASAHLWSNKAAEIE